MKSSDSARVDGVAVAAGNGRLMERLGIQPVDCRPGQHRGVVDAVPHKGQLGLAAALAQQLLHLGHLVRREAYAGHIVISDVVKPRAKEAVSALKRAWVSQTVMLTGDSRKVAEQVAAELGTAPGGGQG